MFTPCMLFFILGYNSVLQDMTIMGKFRKNGSNNFSKFKKRKQEFGRTEKKPFKSTGKRGRLIVRNLPYKCNEDEVYEHFKAYGEIKDIQLLRRPDKKLVGCGFVEFTTRHDADKAKDQLTGKYFLGRPIYIERAVSRDSYDVSSNKEDEEINKGELFDENNIKNELDESEIKEEPMSDGDENYDVIFDTSQIKEQELSSGDEDDNTKNKKKILKNATDEKNTKNTKRARVIIRNLSFKTTDDKLKIYFSQFGDITEIKLLRRPNGNLVGCGFIQFLRKSSAAKAIHYASGQTFLGRPIIIDWAVQKDKFKQMQEEAAKREIKKEIEGGEQSSLQDVTEASLKKEEKSDDNESEEESEEDSEENDSEEESDEEDDDDENEEDDDRNIKQEGDESRRQRKDDVDEGKTVFVKNLPFSVNDKEFQECMEQFGPVFYALICKDKFTEHSKGSGFVKFKKKEDAEKCLSAGTELTLKGNILDPHPALKRNEIEKLKDKTKEKKDNRNLYLVKEGIIVAGTSAAKGVSIADMEHRLQLEQWKTNKLRNLNMFVSRNRLVVHNLPTTFSDKQLRKLFKKHAGAKTVIKEARVMKDLKHVDNKGVSVSKGYGFVSFEKHEDALQALRTINNNPNIFTPTTRPIVSFSIENRAVLNTKTKRMVRSRQKNPLCKEYNPEQSDVPVKRAKLQTVVKQVNENEHQFSGIVAKPGATVKLRQKYKLKDQAQQHLQDVKKQKREMKVSRKLRRTEHLKKKQIEKRSSKQKKSILDNDSAFTNLVDKYKTKILSHTNEKKKWYDE